MKNNGTSARVLIVSDQRATVRSLCSLLAGACEVETVNTGLAAIERVCHEPVFHLVFLELKRGKSESLDILRQLRRLRPALKIIVLSAANSIRQMVDAIRLGAQDYLIVPVEESEFDSVRERYLSRFHSDGGVPATEVEQLSGELCFVAASSVTQKIRAQAELLANIDVPVLIVGESGTGKEVAARLIHKLSSRADHVLLKVNCAALPGELLESELFGHERGAFTGALKKKHGKFELCNKGTILLDEIAEMPIGLQAKLLHVLQDRQFFRVGGESTIDVDVRVLAATNVNIDRAIAQNTLREDLYYRLSAFTIQIPPLRERKDEIPVLLKYFLGRQAASYALPLPALSSRLLDACLNYRWPGNLRELENFSKRYLVMADEQAALAELRPKASPGPEQTSSLVMPKQQTEDNGGNGKGLKSLLKNLKGEAEINVITQELEKTNWNRKRAARNLHISYRGLLYKIQQYGLAPVKNSLSQ